MLGPKLEATDMARKATAEWKGNLKGGNGLVALGSGAYEGPYDFASRFENGEGTNPEELLGAALSGCYSMNLAHLLDTEGHTAERVHTTAKVHLGKTDDGFAVTLIELDVKANVPGIEDSAFQGYAKKAEETCIIARALAATEVTMEATLE